MQTIGRYVVGPKLGEGGMGEVLLAIDPVLGREVAIKRMRERSSASVERFVREACVQARLDHPAIVPVYELSEDAHGRPYLVMKRLSGKTLAELLDTPGVPQARLLRAFVEVCHAIELAHARGIVHRDLKPSNVMLGDLGEVYVLDWGVALLGDDLDAPPPDGTALGTPGYIAPEQIDEPARTGPAADIYSLGCILFEILAGVRLHPPGLAGLASAISGRARTVPGDHNLPRALDALCTHATALEPRARPTAHELARGVERYLDRPCTQVRRSNKLGLLGFVPFVPLLVWTGLHDPRTLPVPLALVATGAAITWATTRRTTSGQAAS